MFEKSLAANSATVGYLTVESTLFWFSYLSSIHKQVAVSLLGITTAMNSLASD